uniref:ORF63d n=1 Tax=Pinus koraiensis TaxID=88728 RepID=A4QM91_PINKO|nr:ORF63d [Pinus koraiensis]ABP35428.1 ORF63d [Pinus koraiensis]
MGTPNNNGIYYPYIGVVYPVITRNFNYFFSFPTNSILLSRAINMRGPSHGVCVRTIQSLDSWL